MSWLKDHKWWGLYLIAPLSAALLYLDGRIHVNVGMHELLAMATIALVFGLTLYWTETHADLVQSEGVDAHSPDDLFRAAGVLIISPSIPPIPVGRPRRSAGSLPAASARALHQEDFLATAGKDRAPAVEEDLVLN